MSYFERTQIQAADTPNLDAFSRWRVSQPQALLAVQCQYNAQPVAMEGGATGTGVAPAHQANSRMVKLSATAGSGTSFFQSYAYVPYQPGKSQYILMTGLFEAGVAGAVKDIGYFDAANGIFYRQNGASGLQVVRRSSTSGGVVDEAVNQADWNLDPLDGTGPSGITLDPATVFILAIDLQYLGMGRVRIGFDIGGVLIYVHQFLHANVLAVPYMQTATLPVAMLLTATATGSTANCYFKCANVNSEGGFQEDLGRTYATAEGTVTAGSGAQTHILSVRPKTTFNSIANRSRLLLDSVEILVTGTNPVRWELAVGCTFSAAPTYADINANCSYEAGTGGTLNTVGTMIQCGYVAASNQTKGQISEHLNRQWPITLDRAGAVRANGTLSLLVTGIGGTSATRASLCLTEIR